MRVRVRVRVLSTPLHVPGPSDLPHHWEVVLDGQEDTMTFHRDKLVVIDGGHTNMLVNMTASVTEKVRWRLLATLASTACVGGVCFRSD